MSFWRWLQTKDALIARIAKLEEDVEWHKRIAADTRRDYYAARAGEDLKEEYDNVARALYASEKKVEELKRVVLSQGVELEEYRVREIEP